MKRWKLLGLLTALAAGLQAKPLPPASPEKLPRWRGFNLMEKFKFEKGEKPYVEEDFKWMAQWGFNFVRLPLDYRFWVKDWDWNKIDESKLKDIDQAVEWGKKYGLHVDINFHRAPGYCVNAPAEPKDLWSDPEALSACARHWALFARRYKGIPNKELSFNLLNEPGDVAPDVHYKVVKALCEAIRAEDPERLIIADGNYWAHHTAPELIPLKVAQSSRGYDPSIITMYKARWVPDSDKWPIPVWPALHLNNILASSAHPAVHSPLSLAGPAFKKGGRLRLAFKPQEKEVALEVRADGKSVAEQRLSPTAQPAELQAQIPAGTKQVDVIAVSGDWCIYTLVGIQPQGQPEQVILPTREHWDETPSRVPLSLDAKGRLKLKPAYSFDKAYLQGNYKAWSELKAQGVGVHIGEWGVFQHTPHPATLAFMEDMLKIYKERGFGWALWNFRGGFGVVDSGRSDVDYEDFQGHKLDRKMLELLRKY